MIWLTWRQFRVQTLVALAALAALSLYLVFLGDGIRETYEEFTGCTGCGLSDVRQALQDEHAAPLLLAGLLVLLVPAILGAFWGAPLIAREIETGTYRLVWNQSVSRVRWLAVKLTVVVAVAVALAGAFSALLTWAASPYDEVMGNRFEPLLFPTRNIVPLGYALFAVVTGIAVGLFARRTVVAMAITLAIFAGLQILMPTVVRPHLQPPVTEAVEFATDGSVDGFGIDEADQVSVHRYTIPNAWVFTTTSQLVHADGAPATRDTVEECFAGDFERDAACLAAKDLHFDLSYQPADRYWTFQWLEFGIYLALAGLLAGLTFWRIRRSLN